MRTERLISIAVGIVVSQTCIIALGFTWQSLALGGIMIVVYVAGLFGGFIQTQKRKSR